MTTTEKTITEVRYEGATSSEQFVTLDPEAQGMHGVRTGEEVQQGEARDDGP
jgi:hypothetical protein